MPSAKAKLRLAPVIVGLIGKSNNDAGYIARRDVLWPAISVPGFRYGMILSGPATVTLRYSSAASIWKMRTRMENEAVTETAARTATMERLDDAFGTCCNRG